jgi:hypothetical protein
VKIKVNLVLLLFISLGCAHAQVDDPELNEQLVWLNSLEAGKFINQYGEHMVLPENVTAIEVFTNQKFLVRVDQKVEGRLIPKSTFAIIDDEQKVLDHFSSAERSSRGRLREGLYAYIENGKLGYKDFNGWVIQPVWDDGGDFSSGLASVILDGNRYFINKQGEIVLDVTELADSVLGPGIQISDFINGYARVTDRSDPGNWRTTYIDKTGSKISRWHDGSGTFFYEGYALIQTFLGGPCYFINEQGEMVDGMDIYDFASRFSGGLAVVGSNKKFGYVNPQGEMVIPMKYNYATPFVWNQKQKPTPGRRKPSLGLPGEQTTLHLGAQQVIMGQLSLVGLCRRNTTSRVEE